jgi:hypothetical protein
MKKDFKVGDHVGWNSEAGRGTIKKKITSAITFKGYTVRASKEEPQYLIKSDTTDRLAMHKGSAPPNGSEALFKVYFQRRSSNGHDYGRPPVRDERTIVGRSRLGAYSS